MGVEELNQVKQAECEKRDNLPKLSPSSKEKNEYQKKSPGERLL